MPCEMLLVRWFVFFVRFVAFFVATSLCGCLATSPYLATLQRRSYPEPKPEVIPEYKEYFPFGSATVRIHLIYWPMAGAVLAHGRQVSGHSACGDLAVYLVMCRKLLCYVRFIYDT